MKIEFIISNRNNMKKILIEKYWFKEIKLIWVKWESEICKLYVDICIFYFMNYKSFFM